MGQPIGPAIAYRVLRERHSYRPEVIEEAINRATAECLRRQLARENGTILDLTWGRYERRSCCGTWMTLGHVESPEHCERLFMEAPR